MSNSLIDTKRKISDDWESAFPELKAFSRNKFYKIIGPVLIGLELVKLPRVDAYRPHFVCYPLWKSTIKSCLESPIFLKEFYNKKGLQISIPYTEHNTFFFETLSIVSRNTPLPLQGDITLVKLFSVIDDHSKSSHLKFAPRSYLQALLQEAKFKIALVVGNDSQVNRLMKQIKKKDWDVEHFKMWNVDYDQWVTSLEEIAANSSDIWTRVEANKTEKKTNSLIVSKLI